MTPPAYEVRIRRRAWEREDASAYLTFASRIVRLNLDFESHPNFDCPHDIGGATLWLDRRKKVTVLGKDRADLLMSYLATLPHYDARFVTCQRKEEG